MAYTQVVIQQQTIEIGGPAIPASAYSANVSVSPQLLQTFTTFSQQPVGDVGAALILRVDPSSGAVVVLGQLSGSLDDIKAQISQSEPRFLVYRFKNAAGEGSQLIIYTALNTYDPDVVEIYDRYLEILQDQLQIQQVAKVEKESDFNLDFFNNIIGLAFDAAGNVVKTAAYLAGGIITTGVNICEAGVEICADVAGAAVSTAANVAGAVVSTAANVAGAAVETAANLAGAVVGTAANVVGAGVEAVADVAGAAINVAENVVGGVASAIGGLFGGLFH